MCVHAGGVLYWCDSGLGHISSVKTDGSDRQLLVDGQLKRTHVYDSIVVDPTYLYVTDTGSGWVPLMPICCQRFRGYSLGKNLIAMNNNISEDDDGND